ncbi:MAG: amino acid ABC transporter permease [Gemmobacter sp.]
MNYTFHWRPVWRSLPQLLEAALVTLEVAVVAMVIGTVLGLLLALSRMNGPLPLRWFAVSWIELARNTPVLLQLFFVGFGLGAVGILLSPWTIVITALSFNTAGYLAENFRGGFQAVPDTQYRAARSLGMTATQAYARIITPQVFRIVYFPLTNQLVWVVLMSSLGMLVGFRELAGETQFFASRTFRIFEYFAVTAVIYYVIVKILILASRLIAWRLFRW